MPATFTYFAKGEHIPGAGVTILRLNVQTDSQSSTRYRIKRSCCGLVSDLDHSRIARYAREGRNECRVCSRLSAAVHSIVAAGRAKGLTDRDINEIITAKNRRRTTEGKPPFKPIPIQAPPDSGPEVLSLEQRRSRDYPSLRIPLPLWPAPPSALRRD